MRRLQDGTRLVLQESGAAGSIAATGPEEAGGASAVPARVPPAGSAGRSTGPPAGPGASLRLLRRWWKWLFFALAVLGVRLSIPALVAPAVSERLSRALGTRVEVGDVGLQPIDAVFTLHDVKVHAPGGDVSGVPPVVARRVRADVQWLPLLHQTLRIRELRLESATVEADRQPDGGLGLARLGEVRAERGLPRGWSFELDRIGLRSSRLRLHDPEAGDALPFEIDVRDAEVSGLRSRATAFGRAANLRVDAAVGRGRLTAYGRYDPGVEGVALDVMTRLKDVPVNEAAANLPDLGWASVDGQLTGQVRWQREPNRRDVLTGRVALRRAAIHVPGVEEPALRVRRAIADLDGIDVEERRIALGSLELQGATLAVQGDADAPVPLLSRALRRLRPTARGNRRRVAPGADDGADDTPSWMWTIKRFDTPNGRLRVVAADETFDMRMRITGENLGPRAYFSPITMRLWSGEGTASFEGTTRFSEGFVTEGRLVAGGLDLRDVARIGGLRGAALIEGGRVAADLSLAIDTGGGESQPIDVRGPVTLTAISISEGSPGVFSAGAAAVTATLDGIELRGHGAKPPPVSTVRLTDVVLGEPWILLTRESTGWVLPAITEAAAAALPAPDPTPTPTPAPAPARGGRDGRRGGAVPAASSPGAAPAVSPQVVLRDLRANGGRVVLVDRVPKPPVTWDVSKVSAASREFRFPGAGLDALQVAGWEPRFGAIELGIRSGERRDTYDFSARGGLLAAATPYLERVGLPFRFVGGRGSVHADVTVADDRWAADTEISLSEPRISGSVAAIENALDAPLPVALAALRDPQGWMTIRMPLSSADDFRTATFSQRIASAVRSGIRRAAEAPPPRPEDAGEPAADDRAGERGAAVVLPRPTPSAQARRLAEVGRVEIPFPVGRADLADAGTAEVTSLAATLLSRPGVLARLSASTTSDDRRWLAEQALSRELARGGAMRGMLRAFGVGAARERIRTALERRSVGQPGLLSGEDEEELGEYLAEQQPLPPAVAAGLRDARLERVASRLVDVHGLPRRRLEIEPGESRGTGTPSVLVTLLAGTAGTRVSAEPAGAAPND